VAFQSYFIAGAIECQIDRSGRILIPNNLRVFAGIQRECFIIGNLTKFEIWSKERWDETLQSLSQNINGLAASMGELGISL
jgi:MraZ protein